MILESKASRTFFVLLGLLLAGSIALWYWGPGDRYVHPTEWYYWTQNDEEAGIDIRSPTSRAIINAGIIPQWGWPAYERLARYYKTRCTPAPPEQKQICAIDPPQLTGSQTTDEFMLRTWKQCLSSERRRAARSVIAGATWRDVELCNAAGLEEKQFSVAHSYFMARVDEDYTEMYGKVASDLAKHVFAALGIWCVLVLAWRTYLWVASGK